MSQSLAPSGTTAFNLLPIKINQAIAHNLNDDKDITVYRLICQATNNAVNADNMSFWRKRFREKYDFVDGPSSNQLRRMYQDRSKMLRCGTQYEFFRGHGGDEAHTIRILRDLIVESFHGTSEADEHGRLRCKNHAHIIDFILKSRIINNDRPLPEPLEDEPAHMDQTLAAVKLMSSHFILNLPDLEHKIFAFHKSQFAVYQSAVAAPIFSTDHRSVNLEWVLHCMNFFRHHIMNKEDPWTLYDCTGVNLLSAWQGPLIQGAQPLTECWMGTYAYLSPCDIVQLRNQGPDAQKVYTDRIIEEGMAQYMDLSFPQDGRLANGRKLKWPRFYEQQLRSICNDDSKKLIKTEGGYLVKSTESIQFEGEGTFLGSDCDVLGWINTLPPQGGIPGWQRITFAKQFLHDQAFGNDKFYAHEGVVLPGGRIMLGRWWLVSGDAHNVLGDCKGPFMLWAYDRPVVDSEESYDGSTNDE